MSGQEESKLWSQKCAVCRQTYYQPKILPCFHTFCLGCLEAVVGIMVRQEKEEEGYVDIVEMTSKADSHSFPCPICQTDIPIPGNGIVSFKDNDYIPDLKGSSDKNRSIATVHCLVCPQLTDNKVAWVCYNCKKMMCDTCHKSHLQFAAKGHDVQPIASNTNTDEELYAECPEPEELSLYETNNSRYENFTPNTVAPVKSSRKEGYIEMRRPLKTNRKFAAEDPPALPPRSSSLLSRLLQSTSCPNIAGPAAASDKSTSSSESEEENSATAEYEDWELPNPPRSLPPPPPSKHPPAKPEKNPNEPDMLYLSTVDVSAGGGQDGDKNPYEAVQFSLVPKQLKLKNFRGKIHFVCFTDDGNLILFCTSFKKRREPTFKMKVFGRDGKCQSSTSLDKGFSSMALLEEKTRTETKTSLVVSDKEKSVLLSTAIQSGQFSEVSQIVVDNPVLSKPAPGQPLYVIGTNEYGQHDCQRVLLRRSTSPYSIDYKGTVMAFDVSSNGYYFALLGKDSDVTVEVYRKDGERTRHVGGYNFDDRNGRGDISFYVPQRGQFDVGELLVIADNVKNRLFLLDYVADCRIVGKKRIDSPVCIAKDGQGSLVLCCDTSAEESTIFVC